ncbi:MULTISPECIES: trimeric intracellular cation channel family protein [unclassified Psychrobacter]|uniref:trimeric intracellular cation channel family protein n=1 Tax=unclassified Psychrobacter TaxID=196806 RepID=UPI0025D8DD64|nr:MULTISPECIES: trimeric intracellular cation channel family protein [unclassified Psychrobacter]
MLTIALDSDLITTFDPGSLIYLFDMIGIVACSISGTILAKHKNFDVFGCLLVSIVTAIGGGTVRDVILDRHPLFWMVDMSYLTVITLSSMMMQIFFHPNSRRVDKFLKLSDTIGLSAFTLIGIKVADSMGANVPVALLLGVITIIVGGIIRDMICNEIPLVLQQEIYISASLTGGILYFALHNLGVTAWITDISAMATIFTLRMLAIRYDWQFPTIEWRY